MSGMVQRIKGFRSRLVLLSVRMRFVLTLFVLAFLVFLYITRKIFLQNKTRFDENVFRYLDKHVSDRNNRLMLSITYLGRHEFLIPANLTLIAYVLFVKKNKWYSIKIPVIALSSLALMFILKDAFERPRPRIPLLEEASGLSFPSGHALMSVTFYGLLIYIIWKNVPQKGLRLTLALLLLLLILLIGFSRIYLRVHYASDVIAGFCIGFIWLVLTIWLLNEMEKYSLGKLNAEIDGSVSSTLYKPNIIM
jgi:membrane-associated phospholipid phosphatase